MKVYKLFIFCFIGGLFSCNNDEIYINKTIDLELESTIAGVAKNGDPTYFILPEAGRFDELPQDPLNPITEAKVALGKLLFFETGIGNKPTNINGEGTYSCATCHLPSAGFRPGSAQGIADGGMGFGNNGEARTKQSSYHDWELDVQGVRPLSVLNVAYVENTTWNGRFGSKGVNVGTEERWALNEKLLVNKEGYKALESQNIEGLTTHRMDITEEVLDDFGYRSYFDDAFYGWPKAYRYSKKAAAFAISAYLRTLITNKAPFQDYLKGNRQVLSLQEKNGAILFFGKAGCANCHKNKNLGANEFYALGVNDLANVPTSFNTSPDDPANMGRGEYTGEQTDMFKFKIPQLYNLSDAPFYFHGSSMTDLKDVVNYFNNGVPENPNVPTDNLAKQFRPLYLSDQEVEDLTVFLEKSLRDPDLERYAPTSIPSGNCFPNNDRISRVELGCN